MRKLMTGNLLNPFDYGSGLDADRLVDRAEEVREVRQAITTGKKLFLIGPRRYGKTSILKAAQQLAEQNGATVIRLTAEAYPTLEELLAALVTAATRQLSGNLTKAQEWARKVFGHLKPEISFDFETQTLRAQINADTDPAHEKKQIPMLVETLDSLENLAAKTKQSVGLMIDEFQRIIELGGEAAEGQIRAAIQEHKRVGYVFAGSKTRMLAEMTTHPSRPFYHLGDRLYLGEIPRADFLAHLQQEFTRPGWKVEEAALTELLELAADVPYNVQQLAHFCWNQLRDAGQTTLNVAVVKTSLERILTREDQLLTTIWNRLTTVQQRTLLAVVQERGKQLHSVQVMRKHSLSPASITQSLRILQEAEILRTDEKRGTVGLRFINPFFAHWITSFRAN
jgi:hypothetical protein